MRLPHRPYASRQSRRQLLDISAQEVLRTRGSRSLARAAAAALLGTASPRQASAYRVSDADAYREPRIVGRSPSLPALARPPCVAHPPIVKTVPDPGHGSSCRAHAAALRRETHPTGFTQKPQQLRTGPGFEARSFNWDWGIKPGLGGTTRTGRAYLADDRRSKLTRAKDGDLRPYAHRERALPPAAVSSPATDPTLSSTLRNKKI